MQKNHEITIKVSKEELEKIKRKADRLCMPVSVFLRFLGLTANINVKTPPKPL